jgi:hypothetical protein
MSTKTTVDWTLSYHPQIDFCLWCLQHDGTKVAPFDVHDSGDRSFARLGLSPTLWLDWLHRVVESFELAMSSVDRNDMNALGHEVTLLTRPAELAPGSRALVAALGESWEHYRQRVRSDHQMSEQERLAHAIARMPPLADSSSLSIELAIYPVTRVLAVTKKTFLVGWTFNREGVPSVIDALRVELSQ